MNPGKLYFDSHGRVGRQQFWLGLLGAVAVLALTIFVIMWLVPIFAVVIFVLWPLAILILAIKRLHDRGKSGWWVVPFVFVPHLLSNFSDKLTEGESLWWVLIVAGCALSLWGLVEIGFLRGTAGDNEYGPDPLAKSAYRPAPSDEVGSMPAPDA